MPIARNTRILVAASRVGQNVLARVLENKGFTTISFPELTSEPPSDIDALRTAAREIGRFDWIVIAGKRSCENFLAVLAEDGGLEPLRSGPKIGAIGHGAVRALKDREIKADYAPRAHTADAVAEGLGPVDGLAVLLVREETAKPALPEALARLGADVTEVAGYRVDVDLSDADVLALSGRKPQVVAFDSPTAVRIFARALAILGIDLQQYLTDTKVATVGPSTEGAVRALGLIPEITGTGRLKSLVRALLDAL